MNTYTIKEVSERSGLSHSTLRYYEEIGLLSGVIHENNKRIYTDDHLRRIDGILCFKNTDLPINKMLEFFHYDEHLEENIDPILELVSEHEQHIQEQIEVLQHHLNHIKRKVWYYTSLKKSLEENTPRPDWKDCPIPE